MSEAATERRGVRGMLDRVTGGAPFFPLFVLFGLNAVDELDRTAFGVLSPEIRDHFGLDLQGLLTVISLVGLAVIFIQVPISFYADRKSRVGIATAGAGTWAFFSIFTGLAGSVFLLGFARAGSGIAQSVNQPTHNSLLADFYDVNVRTKVYSVYRAANSTGQFIGPISAGLLAYYFGWRSPFIIFGIPTLIFFLLAFKLKEPKRGVFERAAAGAGAEVAGTEEEPPSFGEAWRILWGVKTLRRIWISLPFLAASLLGLATLFSLFYEEVFGLNEAQRGLVFAIAEPAQFFGLLIGTPIATRLAFRDPGLVIRMLAIVACFQAAGFILFAVTPSLPVAIVVHILVTGVGAILPAGIYAVLSLGIPPRVRSMGFTAGAMFTVPGLLFLGIVGAIADEYGIRRGLIFMVPIYLIGAFILSSAGKFMRPDIVRVRVSSMAQAEALAQRRAGTAKLLIMRGLDVAYGQTQVLFNVDFEVQDGEIVALLGTNGAGKSTLLKAISGSVEAGAGAIVFDGRDITLRPAHETAAAGVVIVPGGKGAFPTLTVEENFALAAWLYRKDPDHVKAGLEQVFGYFPILKERWSQKAGDLSGGEQQMLTLGQALIAKPKLLMIDELSLGLAPLIVEQLLQVVRLIHETGTTVILVEQSVNVALTLAKRAVFMEKGEIRFNGPTEDLLERPDILRSVFLKGVASALGAEEGGNGRPSVTGVRERSALALGDGERPELLSVTGLAVSFGGIRAVNGVDFGVRQGQILGLIGPNGAGKTTIFDLVSGFLTPDEGRITFDGREITARTPDARARMGLGRSFQDARLFPSMTVAQAIAVALERHVPSRDPFAAALASPGTWLSEVKVGERVQELIELMRLQAFANKFISELSTGSRRIVDLACTVAHDPKVLLLDEPSSGIAQRETEALGPLLFDIRDKTGAGLLVIEHDMPLITSVSEEIIALDLGRIVTRGTPDDVINHPLVIASYLGTSEEAIERSGVRRHAPGEKAAESLAMLQSEMEEELEAVAAPSGQSGPRRRRR